MQGVMRHLRLSRPFLRPFIFPKFELTSPAHKEMNGFEGTSISDILSANNESADGSRLWCPANDTLKNAVRAMMPLKVGAYVYMKPGEQKSVDGVITKKEAQTQGPVRGIILQGRSFVPQQTARKFSFDSLSTRQFLRDKSSTTSDNGNDGALPGGDGVVDGHPISLAEAKKLMRLVNVESLKVKLGLEGKEVISYSELLRACESMGVCRSLDEAAAFAKVLDEAGVVLLFRDKVYLHPDKVVDLVRRSVPLALTSEDDPRKDELKNLVERKVEIDRLARRQVRRILWSGLGVAIVQVGLFFRLTFWEFSWDVMEPIAFFSTTTGIVIGYAYFLFTSKDPTYQDLMERLFLSRQRKLYKKHDFDVSRFMELQDKCKSPLDNLATYKKAQKNLVVEDA